MLTVTDPRVIWLEDWVVLKLAVKPERVRRLLSDEPHNLKKVVNFLENPECMRVFFIVDENHELAVTDLKPASSNGKAVYFLKVEHVQLDEAGMDEHVVVGDMSAHVLSQLHQVCHEVYLPLMSNRENEPGLPDVVVREMLDQFQRLVEKLYVKIGLSKGKTLLPIPVTELGASTAAGSGDGGGGGDDGGGDGDGGEARPERARLEVLEGAVATWTKQIRRVLAAEPEQLLQGDAHPGPLSELDFWDAKAENLGSIVQQLKGDRLSRVLRVLELADSTHFSPFSKLVGEVQAQLEEASSNRKYLSTLRKVFCALEGAPRLEDLPPLFRPLLHGLRQLWRFSPHYRSANRLTVLLRLVCNALVSASRSTIDGASLFRAEPHDALERLSKALDVCATFKSLYYEYKLSSAGEAKEEGKEDETARSDGWEFHSGAVFGRLDAFLERCHDLVELCRTAVHFRELEHIEIGGSKGRTLSASMAQIHADFVSANARFVSLQYDPLDTEERRFEEDFYAFRAVVKELETRIASLLNYGFSECATIFTAIKLIESFEKLLERDFIQMELQRKTVDLIVAYSRDLKSVRDTFLGQRSLSAAGKFLERGGPPLYVNMPPVAGALFWARGLIDRIEEPMSKLESTLQRMLNSEEATEVTQSCHSLLSLLRTFEREQYAAWEAGLDAVTHSSLKQPLLTRDAETGLLGVNFDASLVRLLREAKYLKMLGKEVPRAAAELCAQREVFRVHMGNLELIVNKYNHVQTAMLEVERPLFEAQIAEIDAAVQQGIEHLTWRSHAIDEFLAEVMSLVSAAHSRLEALKANIRAVEAILASWFEVPLFRQKSAKTQHPRDIDAEHKALLNAIYASMDEGGRQIHKLLLASNQELMVSKGAPAWKSYVHYVNEIVMRGLARNVCASLRTLKGALEAQAGARNEAQPMVEVQLMLTPPELVFSPPLEEGRAGSLGSYVHGWIRSFFHVCKLPRRLDRPEGDFLAEVSENEEVRYYVHKITTQLRADTRECARLAEPFAAHSALWTEAMDEELRRFLNSADHAPAAPTVPYAAARTRMRSQPSLAEFEARISKYKKLQDAISSMPVAATVGWIKLDSKPIKQALSTLVTKWTFCYTRHLQDTVHDCLQELNDFVADVRDGLTGDLTHISDAELTQAMTRIQNVRAADGDVEELFEPLRGIVALLRELGVALPEVSREALDKAPLAWEACKKLVLSARERLSPPLGIEAERIKAEAERFGSRVSKLRAAFRNDAPFGVAVGVDGAYAELHRLHLVFLSLEAEARTLSARQVLFELAPFQLTDIEVCRSELRQLKEIWDHVALVDFVLAEWRRVFWIQADLDALHAKAQELLGMVKALENRLCAAALKWGVMTHLLARLDNLLVALPLMKQLADEAMRDRHWMKLMHLCGTSFTFNARVTLTELFRLELHRFVDGVASTVEQARQERQIELGLARMADVWRDLKLEYEVFRATSVALLSAAAAARVYEVLDEHEASLQSMASSQHLSFFESRTAEWRAKLRELRGTLDLWLCVQREWRLLEPIFSGVLDVREQLPLEARKFDEVGAQFKELMASSETNAMDACLKQGFATALAQCLSALENCQSILADYLEVKRRRFARLYLIPTSELLEMVSKGQHPPDVGRHLSSLTPDVGDVVWRVDLDGEPSATAIGLLSTQGERVLFGSPHVCDGNVDEWLPQLLAHAAVSMRDALRECVAAYAESARQKWATEWSAQLCAATARIWFNADVCRAFERIEQGQELALKECEAQIVQNCKAWAQLVSGELSGCERAKAMSLVTLEAHARDVVGTLVVSSVDLASAFGWQSQLRFGWDDEAAECTGLICDASVAYGYEFTGGGARLVLTPVTERCFIAMTQSLKLGSGCALLGASGTGKTETACALGSCLGLWVVLVRCCAQMSARSVHCALLGLAQTGAWGCFDELGSLPTDALAVFAGQLKSVLDALRANRARVVIDDEPAALHPNVGVFATVSTSMSPPPSSPPPSWLSSAPATAAAGVSALPENLKALLRPCALAKADDEAVLRVELQAHGFGDADELARKLAFLFAMGRELMPQRRRHEWGLRSLKASLRLAGEMKRDACSTDEMEILVRALQHSYLPRFTPTDTAVFGALVSDVFGKVSFRPKTAPRQTVVDALVAAMAQGAATMQPEEAFVGHAVALHSLLASRHAVFVLGETSAGKSSIWQTLARAQPALCGHEASVVALDPKAATVDELFGHVDASTHAACEGSVVKALHDLCADGEASGAPQWLVLDGDVDAEWADMINCAMEEHKVLSVSSNERLRLSPSVRILFETTTLRHASPAMVARGGLLHVPLAESNWRLIVVGWLERASTRLTLDSNSRLLLEHLCDQYLPPTLKWVRQSQCKFLAPMHDCALVETTCALLEGLLAPHDLSNGAKMELFDAHFQHAVVNSFGGALAADRQTDYRKKFSEWWRTEWKRSAVKFPDEGLVLDYYVDANGKLTHWREAVPHYTHVPGVPFGSILVPTVETARIGLLVDSLSPQCKPLLIVGASGCAKTATLSAKLRSLGEGYASCVLSLSALTTAAEMRRWLAKPLEKATASVYAPPHNKLLIYLIDDCNMPTPDRFGSRAAVAHLRHHLDYDGFWDETAMRFANVRNVSFVAAMAPTAADTPLGHRVQRRFATFGLGFSDAAVVKAIYKSILDGHFRSFAPEVSRLSEVLVDATLSLHADVAESFLPTAAKAHYLWSMRDISAVMQGVCRATADYYDSPAVFVRLWLYELHRVYCDRLVSRQDCDRLKEQIGRVSKSFLPDMDQEELHAAPLAYASFAVQTGGEDKVYFKISGYDKLRRLLQARLDSYNELHAPLDLVLFEQAMEHVLRISRVIDVPRGSALLVGVGGAGRQALTRFAAFIGGHALATLRQCTDYSPADFHVDMRAALFSAGVHSTSTVLLISEAQLPHEEMFMCLNSLLSTGLVPALHSTNEQAEIISAIRAQTLESDGMADGDSSYLELFAERVRSNVHLVLCMSPSARTFRARCRKFPALTSRTTVNWFHAWPEQALIAVAHQLLPAANVFGSEEVRENAAHHMAFAHQAITKLATQFHDEERREVLVTPRSYLELATQYGKMLKRSVSHLEAAQKRLQTGLDRMANVGEQVQELREQLEMEQLVAEQKKAETDDLLAAVGKESGFAEEQASLALEEKEKLKAERAQVAAYQEQCAADVRASEPAMKEAESALSRLDKNAVSELKSLTAPPKEVLNVTAAVAHMLSSSHGFHKKPDVSWLAAKKMMSPIDSFVSALRSFDVSRLSAEAKQSARSLLGPESIKTKSLAAVSLAQWVANVCVCHDWHLELQAKRQLLHEAETKLADTNKRMLSVKERMLKMEARKAELQQQLVLAMEEKHALSEVASATAARLSVAERLIGGVQSETARWATRLEATGRHRHLLIGDSLLAAAFVAYAGPFTQAYRHAVCQDVCVGDMLRRSIPISAAVDAAQVLSDARSEMTWQRWQLPSERRALENALIVAECGRPPLLVDPQSFGARWVREVERPNGLISIQPSRRGAQKLVEGALREGLPVLVEVIGESLDALLEPVVRKSIVAKGRKALMSLAGHDVEVLCATDEAGAALAAEPLYRIYLTTRLPNPRLSAGLQTQVAVVDFTVTAVGLEEQLLAEAVAHECVELEQRRVEVRRQLGDVQARLGGLQDAILTMLASAEGDILETDALVVAMEATRSSEAALLAKKKAAERTADEVAGARELYRPIAARGVLIYSLARQLERLDMTYQFSMAGLISVFKKALGRAKSAEAKADPQLRQEALVDALTLDTFGYLTRGLFERHRFVLLMELAMRVAVARGELSQQAIRFFIDTTPRCCSANPLSTWLPDEAWAAVQALASLDGFKALPREVEGASKRWKEWFEAEQPERAAFPQEWESLSGFDRLLLVRALRPDRLLVAGRLWASTALGSGFVAAVPFDLETAMEDAGPATPVLFLLSEGCDPASRVAALAAKRGLSVEQGTLLVLSLGVGHELVAEKAVDAMHRQGGWLLLQNVELVAQWLPWLETFLEALNAGVHSDFRVFLSALPSPHLPVTILQDSVKLTDEPPLGLKAGMARAYLALDESVFDRCARPAELRAAVFALAFFHVLACERRRFGAIGWSGLAPCLADADFGAAVAVARRQLDTEAKPPWVELRHLICHVLYGGHMPEPADVRLCAAYVDGLICDDLREGFALAPTLCVPSQNLSLSEHLEYIEEAPPQPLATACGLPAAADVHGMEQSSQTLLRSLSRLQLRGGTGGGGGGGNGGNGGSGGKRTVLEVAVKRKLDDILERLSDRQTRPPVQSEVEEHSPYTYFFVQECERMYWLVSEIRLSLQELDSALKGDLSLSAVMERLMHSLYQDTLPEAWAALSWPWVDSLGAWLADLVRREKQLAEWTSTLTAPKVVWICGFFRPLAFLMAMQQVLARRNGWRVEQLSLSVDVSKKTNPEDIESASRDGAYVHGLFLEGARWDVGSGVLEDARPKQLCSPMPLMLIKAAPSEHAADSRDIFACPVYQTRLRRGTFVFTAGLRMRRTDAKKWTLAGVALLMQAFEAAEQDTLPPDALSDAL